MMKDKIEKDSILPLFPDLNQLNTMAEQFQQSFLSPWEKTHRKQLKQLKSILDTGLQSLNHLVSADFQSSSLWQDVETMIRQLLAHTEYLRYIPEDYSSALFWKEWETQFQSSIKTIPSSVKVTASQDDLEIKQVDAVKIRLWKWLKKREILFRKTGLSILNKTRIKLKKSPLPSSRMVRDIPAHLFFEYHYKLPLSRLFFQTWQKLLQQMAIQIYHMQDAVQEMIYEVILLAEFKDISPSADRERFLKKLLSAKEKLPALNSVYQDLDNFRSEASAQFKLFLAQLNEDIQQDWQYASTYILPNKRFTTKATTTRYIKLEEEFKKSKTGWTNHYTGMIETWNTDLELSLLQVQMTQICVETLQSLDERINDQILPCFDEPINMLSESLKKFGGIVISKETDFRSEILSESRLMLRSLRQEKLPLIIDTLLQAQLAKTLDNYLSRTKHVVASLPNQHRIFRQQDLISLPPDSKFVDIPLKELVLEEIYPNIAKEFDTFKNDLLQKLDKIVRDLSEVDQIVEFNLEAALEILEKSEGTGVLEEAKKVVVEGYERSQNRLNALVEQHREISGSGSETLVQMTIDFTNKIQDLADNEKIIALKLMLAKAKTREELRDFRDNVISGIKSTLPAIVKFITGYVKTIQNRYVRFRKMTGLAPVAEDVEENISRFITKTLKQITALPYVYQRLFRIEPLPDIRFFEGREKDLNLLKQEFELWRSGQFGVTGLIGEKGSGKTTLLNFATEQIYNRIPVVKLQLAESTISTETNLFLYFKQTFKENEIGCLEELENKFSSMNSQRIIIVEDLQNLFLRTVDGFEALERFLLFVSRTHKNVYWIITCTLYSWRYLDKVMNISKFFQRVILLGGLTSGDIENIILKRHRVSGFKLQFEGNRDIIQSKKFKKLTTEATRQEFFKDFYFKQLNELSAGNITVTIMFWLSSIIKIDQDTMVISSEMTLDFSFLHQLPSEELFTLAAFLHHETLTLEEHARVFHQDKHQSSLLLKRMTNKKILYEKSNGNYQINFLLYRAVVSALTIKNIIH